MPDPIQTLVIENLVSTLRGITKAGGYDNSLDKAEQVVAFGESIPEVSKFPAVLVHVVEDAGDYEFHAGFVEHRMVLALQCIARDGNANTARSTAQGLVADIQRALMNDHQRGGYAIDTRVSADAVEFDLTSLPHIYFTVAVEIEYRHGVRDPRSQDPSL